MSGRTSSYWCWARWLWGILVALLCVGAVLGAYVTWLGIYKSMAQQPSNCTVVSATFELEDECRQDVLTNWTRGMNCAVVKLALPCGAAVVTSSRNDPAFVAPVSNASESQTTYPVGGSVPCWILPFPRCQILGLGPIDARLNFNLSCTFSFVLLTVVAGIAYYRHFVARSSHYHSLA